MPLPLPLMPIADASTAAAVDDANAVHAVNVAIAAADDGIWRQIDPWSLLEKIINPQVAA
ncbi:MAG: hypothetical protein U5N55_04845 [Cypionkella sp.]|nr:hypothetical protein [Cypionkella sp.]